MGRTEKSMTKEIIKRLEEEEWYQAMIEECQAILTEGTFNARWSLIEAYHNLGKRISEENDSFKRKKIYGKEIVKHVAQSLGIGDRTIYYAIQFVKKYPKLDELPEGKNVSWHKICNDLLPQTGDGKEIRHYMNCLIDHEEKAIWINSKYKDYKIQYRD